MKKWNHKRPDSSCHSLSVLSSWTLGTQNINCCYHSVWMILEMILPVLATVCGLAWCNVGYQWLHVCVSTSCWSADDNHVWQNSCTSWYSWLLMPTRLTLQSLLVLHFKLLLSFSISPAKNILRHFILLCFYLQISNRLFSKVRFSSLMQVKVPKYTEPPPQS